MCLYCYHKGLSRSRSFLSRLTQDITLIYNALRNDAMRVVKKIRREFKSWKGRKISLCDNETNFMRLILFDDESKNSIFEMRILLFSTSSIPRDLKLTVFPMLLKLSFVKSW